MRRPLFLQVWIGSHEYTVRAAKNRAGCDTSLDPLLSHHGIDSEGAEVVEEKQAAKLVGVQMWGITWLYTTALAAPISVG